MLPAAVASNSTALAVAVVVTLAAAVLVVRALMKRHGRGPGNVATIAAIGTAVPSNELGPSFYLKMCESVHCPPEMLAKVSKVIASGGIETRHSVVTVPAEEYFALLQEPGKRAALWEEHAPELAIAAARNALSQWRHGGARDVTHIVTHSCTGFSAPGLDFALINALGLPSDTRKLGVNFMGCFGGMTALYVAKQIVEADATGKAVVLIACAEVCSSHAAADPTLKMELVMGNTLFSDGAAAAVVTHAGFRGRHAGGEAPPAPPARINVGAPHAVAGDSWEWSLGAMASELIPDSGGAMTWKQAPRIAGAYDMWLDRSIPGALTGLFAGQGLGLLLKVGIYNPFGCAWALHPGGKGIITGFESALKKLGVAKPAGLSASHDVLREYGNMSSATILFVLQRVLSSVEADKVFFAGFGPGLTIEFGCLNRVVR